jgi:ParB family chromosome partitioning protein
MSPHQLINQDSGNTEYYTDAAIVESARRVLGGIDLDPASSAVANKVVKATRFYSIGDDGLKQHWNGKVWMNHPFQKGLNHLWIQKLVESFKRGDVSAAICICFASTSEKWFQPLLQFPQCFPSRRTNYFLPDGTKKSGVTKGSVITYLGGGMSDFKREFSIYGTIKVLG